MMKIVLAALLLLAAGMAVIILVVRKRKSSANIGFEKKDIIVNQGVDVATGQIGSNQNKYFKGMSGEVSDTICIQQMSVQGYIPQNPYTQIIFCNVETGRTVTKNLAGSLELGRGMWEGSQFLHISENRMVSNRHCRILRENGIVYVEDLQSRNHTYLNNRQVVQRMRLKSGDIIALGTEQFRITFY